MGPYHEATKHTATRLRASRHALDWANQPDPFRHYEGVPVLDLPADPPAPSLPATRVLAGERGEPFSGDGAAFLSSLLFHAAAVSAAKRVPATGYRYALRVNPSSGNLHPTEFHFATCGLAGWPDGLYHYRPSSHMAEQRATGADWVNCLLPGSHATIVFLLTTITWREAWKYGDRAYRYCLLDAGHAWQCLALSAQALGVPAQAHGLCDGEALAAVSVLAADEWPLLLVSIAGGPQEPRALATPERWFGGTPNVLSPDVVSHPAIKAVHTATEAVAVSTSLAEVVEPTTRQRLPVPRPQDWPAPFGAVARSRRSALDFRGGPETISMSQLSTLLASTALELSAADFAADLVHLYLYVHRVDGLDMGVYRHWPHIGLLEPRARGDQRVMAAALSLSQPLAGNACVTLSMIADLERAARRHGPRGYRLAHAAAGAVGQRLYLGAEAMGFRATGIGAFFDDEVHAHLGIGQEEGQVVYHFACGHAVEDVRLA